MDFTDFNELANHYTGAGVDYTAGKAAVVPEPDALFLLASGVLGLALWRWVTGGMFRAEP